MPVSVTKNDMSKDEEYLYTRIAEVLNESPLTAESKLSVLSILAGYVGGNLIIKYPEEIERITLIHVKNYEEGASSAAADIRDGSVSTHRH